MSQRIKAQIAGLVTEPNQLLAGRSPGGLLRQCDNLMLRRPDYAEPRYGFARDVEITAGGSGDHRIRSMHPHDKKGDTTAHDILAMSFDSSNWAGRWFFANTAVTGVDIAPPDSTRYPHKSISARYSLYLTTASGIRKLVTSTDAAAESLMYQAPQCTASLDSSTTNTAILTGKDVGYRYLFEKTDTNGYVVQSAPSPFIRLANGSGSTRNGALRIPLPAYVLAADVVRVYRTLAVATGATLADEEFFAFEYAITSGDVINGYATVIDPTAEADLGEALYTNSGVEGILKANDAPPVAHDVALYQDCAWFANIYGRHTVKLALQANAYSGAAAVAFGVFSTTSDDTGDASPPYTFTVASATNVAIGQLVTTTGQDPTTAGAVFAADTLVTNVSGTTITVDKAMLSAGGAAYAVRFHDTITVGGVSYYADSATVDLFRTFAVTSGGDALAAQIAYIISKTSSTLVGYSIVDQVSRTGTVVIRERSASEAGTSFSFASTKPQIFEPNTTVTSKRDALPHGLAYSKPNLPEAVPEINLIRVGREDRRILALTPLTDALLIWKEDGVWRLSGFPSDDWRLDRISHVRLLTPRCVAVLDDVAYGWTDHGLVAADEAGVQSEHPASEAIGVTLRALQQDFRINYTASSEYVYVVAHPRRQFVALSVPLVTVGDSTVSYWYVFHKPTEAWTRFVQRPEGLRCAVYDPLRDAMYVGRGGAYYEMRKERTTETSPTSCLDDDHAITISAVNVVGSNTRLTLSAADFWEPVAGDVVKKNGVNYYVTQVSSGEAVVEGTTISTGAAVAVETYPVTVEWHPQTAEGPSTVGLWREMALQLRATEGPGYGSFIVGLGGSTERDTTVSSASATITVASTAGRPVRALVPRAIARAQQIVPRVTIRAPGYNYAIEGLSLLYEAISEEVWR